tara:strand:+ start:158 stop:439 length:282 start_codon:yes stop_codon:yes gene_type:complete
MIRYPSIFWIFLVIFSAISIYEIKRIIIVKENKIVKLRKTIDTKKDYTKLLNAELAFLSRPSRIESISKKLLNMKKIIPMDIWNIRDLTQNNL